MSDFLAFWSAAGAVWAIFWFFHSRRWFPRAKISQRIEHRLLEPGVRLVRATATLENVGDVLISVRKGRSFCHTLIPLPAEELKRLTEIHDLVDPEKQTHSTLSCDAPIRHLPKGAVSAIEPGEAHEFYFDFFVPATIQTVTVYSCLEADSRLASWLRRLQGQPRTMGWTSDVICDLQTSERKIE